MVELLRHRQTKGAATDMFYLTPPRHISTLPFATGSGQQQVRPCSLCRAGNALQPALALVAAFALARNQLPASDEWPFRAVEGRLVRANRGETRTEPISAGEAVHLRTPAPCPPGHRRGAEFVARMIRGFGLGA
jgi:hypothetical protein